MSQTSSLTNPNPKLNRGLAFGVQRTAVTDTVPHTRDMLRVSFAGTSGEVFYEPMQRGDLHNFRPDSVVCCPVFVSVTRTSNAPVLIGFGGYHRNSVAMNIVGTNKGPSMASDDTIAVVSPNQGCTFQPTPGCHGAQLSLNNIMGQQLRIRVYDAASGAIATDVSSYFVSLVFFERI